MLDVFAFSSLGPVYSTGVARRTNLKLCTESEGPGMVGEGWNVVTVRWGEDAVSTAVEGVLGPGTVLEVWCG